MEDLKSKKLANTLFTLSLIILKGYSYVYSDIDCYEVLILQKDQPNPGPCAFNNQLISSTQYSICINNCAVAQLVTAAAWLQA